MHARETSVNVHIFFFKFGNSFLTVHILGVVKKIIIFQEGLLYTHSDFHTSACVHLRKVDRNVKRASRLDLITQATDI